VQNSITRRHHNGRRCRTSQSQVGEVVMISPTDPCRRRCLPEFVGDGFMTASFAPAQTTATAAEVFWVDPRPSGGGCLTAPQCEHALSLPEMRPNRYVEHESRRVGRLMPTPRRNFFRPVLRLTGTSLPDRVLGDHAERGNIGRRAQHQLLRSFGYHPEVQTTSRSWDFGSAAVSPLERLLTAVIATPVWTREEQRSVALRC